MKKKYKRLLYIPIVIILIFITFFTHIALTDYKPDDIVSLSVENKSKELLDIDSTFSITTFNIGYCGLDKTEDFFMDGGTRSKPDSHDQVNNNLKKISSFLDKENSDFIMIQEIDKKASRSYDINQYEYIEQILNEYSASFATNFKVPFVPVPVKKPTSYVESGLAFFSKYEVTSSNRLDLPGKEMWIRQLFDLDRCMMENRIAVSNGKELIINNLHLSAYDKGGKVRVQQMKFLQDYIKENYKAGNYIILGGDWNHVITNKDSYDMSNWPEWLQVLPKDFTPKDFKWAFDEKNPSVRDLSEVYTLGETFTEVIDGFLVSPNIEIIDTHGYNLKFENSDHNPVTGSFKLKN
ncbi:endonuclease/exonuclease/phosphatase family protein [Oceanirhabdus seepicola]|uniref:Endonuclease/exonuclease/phosphatase family protein n=1 Tax=Oceanirhabdus seepicola TaxID=2828781 RepID=A0A9J6P171_9CLOT|nr:endonuclease/exonuclease/phosphatase family protein [Oceanirhabdus seepicola]MCM1989966.1 endonuclease/exonuclease/phosphatase family protein [Oceanirhabdus seepicola]